MVHLVQNHVVEELRIDLLIQITMVQDVLDKTNHQAEALVTRMPVRLGFILAVLDIHVFTLSRIITAGGQLVIGQPLLLMVHQMVIII